MPKLTQEQIDAIPGLKAAQKNGDVVFLNLDTEETSPVVTAGFHDEQIQEMNADAMRAELAQCGKVEEQLMGQMNDIRERRRTLNAILKRKTEIDTHGIHHRP